MAATANPVTWFEIYTENLARAKQFYERVLQTTLTPLQSGPDLEMLGFPMDRTAVGCSGALVQLKGVTGGGHGVILYFRSEDCAVEERRIPGAGGKVFKAKMSVGQYGFIVLGVDTEGNMFGVHSLQ